MLKNICLPGNHDSATSNIQCTITTERGKDVVYFFFKNLKVQKFKRLWPVVRGLTKATDQEIVTQLKAGLRAFDFRVFPLKNKFYIVHRFLGEDYENIFQQICQFLDSKSGEILYLHFQFLDKTTTNKTRGEFANVLINKLSKYAITKTEIKDKAYDMFECTYGFLVGLSDKLSTSWSSRVIIHYEGQGKDDKEISDQEIFFSAEQL